jgi:hypothetical protein
MIIIKDVWRTWNLLSLVKRGAVMKEKSKSVGREVGIG